MNRSLLSIAAMSALYTNAAASTFLLNDTRHAGPDYNFMLKNDQDGLPDAGGTDAAKSEVKTVNDVMGDGVDKLAEVRAVGQTQTGEQLQAAISDGAGQVGEVKTDNPDAGSESLGGSTAPVGDQQAGGTETQQA